MSVYYNEIEPSAIAWLKELIKAGEIPDGHIDTRSIVDVRPEELSGFDQCHFFAGIAGWPLALRMAGYGHVKGLWTGSCPCQPFSAAGKRKGTSDARHLWPEMRRLVEQCRPAIVLGEQVASKDGRTWCAGVRADMEALGYAFGAADLCAAGIGAPHIRQRLYWGGHLADAKRTGVRMPGCGTDAGAPQGVQGEDWQRQRIRPNTGTSGNAECSGLGEPECAPAEQGRATDKPAEGTGAGSAGTPDEPGRRGDIGGGLGDAEGGRREGKPVHTNRDSAVRVAQADAGGLGDANNPGSQGHGDTGERTRELSPWSPSALIHCADGKTRRICPEPGVFPLAHGVPGRVGLLRGYGNAIVPQLAAIFVESFIGATVET